MAASNAVAEPGTPEIVLTRVFDAPREMVFDAWADPEQVVQWWGPQGFTTTIKKMEVREGGEWTLTMHGPDGTDYPNKSIFTEVQRPSIIAYRHGGGSKGGPGSNFQMTATFETVDEGKTLLTMRMVFATAESRDEVIRHYGALEGGKQTLGRLSEFLAGKAVAA